MKTNKVIFLALGLLTMLGVSFQQAKAVTFTHPVIELQARPGERVVKTVKIFNETDSPILLYAVRLNFKAQGTEGQAGFEEVVEGDGVVDLASWIENSVPNGLALKPQERKEVDIIINVPQFADPGGHYAAFLWTPEPPKQEEGSTVQLSYRTGHLILLTVAGEVKEEANLDTFRIKENRKLFNHLPVDFETLLNNTGNVHVKPVGQIEIKNLIGRTEDMVTINDKGGNVLPKSARLYKASWMKAEKQYEGTGIWADLIREKENFALGRYVAKMTLMYGVNNQKAIHSQVVFWVFPWRVMTVVTFIGLIILLLLIIGIKKYNHLIAVKEENKIQEEEARIKQLEAEVQTLKKSKKDSNDKADMGSV